MLVTSTRILTEAQQTGASNVEIRATAEARATRLSLVDRLGDDSDGLEKWVDACAEVMRTFNAAVRAAPLAAIAWADAVDPLGDFTYLTEDLRGIAAATPTKEKSE